MNQRKYKSTPKNATADELRISKEARICVPYLRRIMKSGNAPGHLAERLHYVTGLPVNRFIYRPRAATPPIQAR